MTNVQNGLIEKQRQQRGRHQRDRALLHRRVTVQKNETFGTKAKAGGADSNGIDTDKATTKTIIQYNYFHDNGDGILICQFSFGDSIIRYNILQNNSRYQIYLHSDPAASSAIYNNTVYNNKTNSGVAYGYGTSLDASYTMRNNIFFAASGNGVLTTGGGIVYQNNLYVGSAIQVPAGDTAAIKADPEAGRARNRHERQRGRTGVRLARRLQARGRLARHQRRRQPSPTTVASTSGGSTIVGTPDVGAYESR